jgi:hypothetical protein
VSDIQTVQLYAGDRDHRDLIGPLGGPRTTDGLIAMTVSATATSQAGAAVPLETASDATDNLPTQGDVCLLVQPRPVVWNDTDLQWNRMRGASPAAQADTSAKTGVLVALKGSEWGITHDPVAATQATITRAAGGAGTRHVVTGLTVCIAAAAAAVGPVKARLLSAATTLWVGVLSAPVQGACVIALDNLALVAGDNEAVTLQFDAAGAAGSFETVSLSGYSLASSI